MDLMQLRYFCTVAQMLNISRAAAFHSIPQPAMSKTISGLEKELGTQLFSRQKNKLHLTEEGKRFYHHVENAIQEVNLAVSELGAADQNHGTHFRLLVTAMQSKTAGFLAAFRQTHPNVTFEVSKIGTFEQAEPRYALCISEMQPPLIYDRSIPLMTRSVELYAAVRVSDPLARKQRICVSEMEGIPIVSIHPSPVNAAFRALCRKNGFEPNVVITCDDLQCRQQYVLSGAGATIAASYSMRDLQTAGIALVPIDEKIIQTVNVYWSSRFKTGEVWQALFNQLLQFYRSSELPDEM